MASMVSATRTSAASVSGTSSASTVTFTAAARARSALRTAIHTSRSAIFTGRAGASRPPRKLSQVSADFSDTPHWMVPKSEFWLRRLWQGTIAVDEMKWFQ